MLLDKENFTIEAQTKQKKFPLKHTSLFSMKKTLHELRILQFTLSVAMLE